MIGVVTNVRNTADVLVAWLMARTEAADQPPVDLEALAQKMGVVSIEMAHMVEDGRLEQRDGVATIYVRDDLTDGRRRFTIAHELGHRLLLHQGAPAVAYRRRLTGDQVERLCDDIAAAILLPRPWVQGTFRGEPRKLKTIRRMSAMSLTSLSASLVRLREVHRWPESLLRFMYCEDRWRLASPAGVPSAMHGRLRTTTATNDALSLLRERTSADVRSSIPMQLAGSDVRFEAELSVRNNTAFALVDLAQA